jgi:CheY-like chemotaxis protein
VEIEPREILVVDDSPTMRQLLRVLLLRYLVCRVTEATDGVDALAKLQAGSFDLVVSDVNMPRLDGPGLIRGIRESLRSRIPIVVVTTLGGEADRDRCLQLGADAYLTKPVNGGQVARVVAGLLVGGERRE